MTFTHVNVTGPLCDSIQGTSCDPYGVPAHENDVIALRLALDIDMTVSSFFLSFGLLDRVDIGVVLPIVATSLTGTSDAQIIPFGGTTAQHFFGGTPTNPQLSTSRFVQGSASGIGDIAARVKISVTQSERTTFALLGDIRFPTGSEDDLLGSGHLAARGLGILSARFGAFSPHANVGYLFRSGDLQNSAVLATVGFDHLMAPWATMAVDLVSELQVGESKLQLPGPAVHNGVRRAARDDQPVDRQRRLELGDRLEELPERLLLHGGQPWIHPANFVDVARFQRSRIICQQGLDLRPRVRRGMRHRRRSRRRRGALPHGVAHGPSAGRPLGLPQRRPHPELHHGLSRAPRGGERPRGFHPRVALPQAGGRGTRPQPTAERADSRRAQGAHEAVFPLQRRGAGGGFGGGGGGGGGGRGGLGRSVRDPAARLG